MAKHYKPGPNPFKKQRKVYKTHGVYLTQAQLNKLDRKLKSTYGSPGLWKVVKEDPFLALTMFLQNGLHVPMDRATAKKTAESIWRDHDGIDFWLHKNRIIIDTELTQR